MWALVSFLFSFLSVFVLLFLTVSDVLRGGACGISLCHSGPPVPLAVSSLISGGRIVLTVQCLMVLRMPLAILGLANACPFPIFSSASDPAAKSKRKHTP